MKKVQSMSVSQFLNKEEDTAIIKLQRHLKKHHIKYKIIGTMLIIFVAGGVDFATPAMAASSSVDIAMRKIYFKLIDIGKWIIIIKGAIETIKSVTNGDFDGAKKHFFAYLIVYLLLLGLPWAFDEVDKLFSDLTT